MSAAATLVRSLFSLPGNPATDPGGFLKQAASAHEELFRRAYDPKDPDLARSLTPLGEFLGGRAPPAQKERLLCHPLFLEGLHDLAPCCPNLRHWHESVTAPPTPRPPPPIRPHRLRWAMWHSPAASAAKAAPRASTGSAPTSGAEWRSPSATGA